MNVSPMEYVESQRIGSVDFVSPSEIKVALDFDAPDCVALNAGMPTAFPRVNSYLLIPSEDSYVVGQVEWLAVERTPFPKRKGMQDFGLIDLPFPQRKLCLNPVGTLSTTAKNDSVYKLERGVYSFPTIGSAVLLPTESQLKGIVESGKNRRVLIGHAPLAGNAEVRVDPDRLFGRHLAVLGNTGSGKSCTIAGLIKWSLDSAKSQRIENAKAAQNLPRKDVKYAENSRFIILDPNGEYGTAFPEAKKFSIGIENENSSLQVPVWLWNSEEWCAFAQASPKVQKPLLVQALRINRNKINSDENSLVHSSGIISYLRGMVKVVQDAKNNHDPFNTNNYRAYVSFTEILQNILQSLEEFRHKLVDQESATIGRIIEDTESLIDSGQKPPNGNGKRYSKPFILGDINNYVELLESSILTLGGTASHRLPINEDCPVQIEIDDVVNTINFLATNSGALQHVESLMLRLNNLDGDTRMSQISSSGLLSLTNWLEKYLWQNNEDRITVIDLSLVPSEVISIITAVIARVVFEALQRYKMKHKALLPTVLVMEEAHNFVKTHQHNFEETTSSEVCCRVFEKIAREGRKFGLGLVLSSQRPSELSPTVLSQCNSFILHRINNEEDQKAVSRLLPDNLRGMLRELPVLPSKYAFLLGWASELPVLTKILDIPKKNRPESDDPDFWDVWTGKKRRDVNWHEIADEWQGISKDVHIETDRNAEAADGFDDSDPFQKDTTDEVVGDTTPPADETKAPMTSSAEFDDFDDSDPFADE